MPHQGISASASCLRTEWEKLTDRLLAYVKDEPTKACLQELGVAPHGRIVVRYTPVKESR